MYRELKTGALTVMRTLDSAGKKDFSVLSTFPDSADRKDFTVLPTFLCTLC